jgi:hypothetical protein
VQVSIKETSLCKRKLPVVEAAHHLRVAFVCIFQVLLIMYMSVCLCLCFCICTRVCVCVWGSSSLHTHNPQSLLHCISYQEGNRYDLGIFFLLVFVVHGIGSLQPIFRLWNPNPNIHKLGVRSKHTRVERRLTLCPLKDLILTLGVGELSVLCVCVCGLCSDSIRSVKKGSPVCLWIVQG